MHILQDVEFKHPNQYRYRCSTCKVITCTNEPGESLIAFARRARIERRNCKCALHGDGSGSAVNCEQGQVE